MSAHLEKKLSKGLLGAVQVEAYEPAPGEAYMSADQLDHFRTILLTWKSYLCKEANKTVTYLQDDLGSYADPVDRATQEEEFSAELRNRDRERKLMAKIDKTLQRLEQREFGFCENCGEEIGLKRLEARPMADMCIDCKTLAEIREKQRFG